MPNFGKSVIFDCIKFFRVKCIILLIILKIAKLQDRATPIFIASQNGHRGVLLTLLAEGGEPNVCRIDGASPLWIASQMGHDHIVRVLLKSGANVDAVRCVSSMTKDEFIYAKNLAYFRDFYYFLYRMVRRHYLKQRTKDFRLLYTNF